MKTIWKYELQVAGEQKINMPHNSRILSVQVQDIHPCIWALVDTERVLEERTFRIVGTGYPIDFSTDKYIGTFQQFNGKLVYHLFETK